MSNRIFKAQIYFQGVTVFIKCAED
ncbi:TPA: hypothetical protein HA338_16615 [Methanosarcina acetivorans]|uniref:Uncharacterized protein n=1 Tax=Methanosarcina acetivorans TaxID=2214 RepID=A0A832WBT9_9EURY|nr:hypothetical protein [Methanosarcina acetivorans]